MELSVQVVAPMASVFAVSVSCTALDAEDATGEPIIADVSTTGVSALVAVVWTTSTTSTQHAVTATREADVRAMGGSASKLGSWAYIYPSLVAQT